MSEVFQINYTSLQDINDVELINLHRKYWKFIADRCLTYKPAITNIDGEIIYVNNRCFLCEFDSRNSCGYDNFISKCDYCPADFIQGHGCLGGLYNYWKKQHGGLWANRKYAALKIANVPLKSYILERFKSELDDDEIK